MGEWTAWVSDGAGTPGVRTGSMQVVTLGWSQEINAHDQITVTTPAFGGHPDIGALQPGRSLIWVLSDGVPITVGWVTAAQIDVPGETVTWTAVGPMAYFDRRIITTAVTQTAADVLDVARSLITVAQAKPSGSIGLGLDTTTAGVTRDLEILVSDHEKVGEVYARLAEEDGFDWRITPRWVGDTLTATLEHEHPAGGQATGRPITHGTQIDITSADWDGTGLATTIVATGAGSGDTTPTATATIDPGAGLLTEDVVSATDVVDPSVLGQVAARVVARTATAPVRLTGLLRPHPDVSATQPATGEIVDLTADLGPVQIADTRYRVVAKTVAVDQAGTELTTLDLVEAGRFV